MSQVQKRAETDSIEPTRCNHEVGRNGSNLPLFRPEAGGSSARSAGRRKRRGEGTADALWGTNAKGGRRPPEGHERRRERRRAADRTGPEGRARRVSTRSCGDIRSAPTSTPSASPARPTPPPTWSPRRSCASTTPSRTSRAKAPLRRGSYRILTNCYLRPAQAGEGPPPRLPRRPHGYRRGRDRSPDRRRRAEPRGAGPGPREGRRHAGRPRDHAGVPARHDRDVPRRGHELRRDGRRPRPARRHRQKPPEPREAQPSRPPPQTQRNFFAGRASQKGWLP